MGVGCQDSTSMRQRLNDLHILQLHILEHVPRHKSFSKAHHLNSKTEHWNSHRTVPRARILPDHKHQNKKQIWIDLDNKKTIDFNDDFL